MTLNEAQTTKLVALVVTLTVSRAIRLQMDGNLSIDGFNQDWALVSGGLILGQLVNLFGTTKLMEKKEVFKWMEKMYIIIQEKIYFKIWWNY